MASLDDAQAASMLASAEEEKRAKATLAAQQTQELVSGLAGLRDRLHIPVPPQSAGDVSQAELVVPTITVEDHDGKDKEEPPKAKDTVEEPAPAAPAVPVIPDWYTVGWRQMAGVDKPPLLEGEERDETILSQFVWDQFYGSSLKDSGVMFFAIVSTYIVTSLRLGWGWLYIILGISFVAHKTSVERFLLQSKDDIHRELVHTRLGADNETVRWMNHFLTRFWKIYVNVLEATVTSTVDQILSVSAPAFLDSLKLDGFKLGTKAPCIDYIKTEPQVEPDVVQMEWGISFTPKDEMDMTLREIEKKTNPKIVLLIRLGKGLATASLPVLVEDITVSGRIQLRLKLIDRYPYVQMLDFCFLEKPTIEYVLKPLGGETFGFDIASIPGLSSFIRETTHSILGPMMYYPQIYSLNLEQMLSGKPWDSAIGVLKVVIRSARGLKGLKLSEGAPDPFVTLWTREGKELARTKWKKNTYMPTWMETKYILISNFKEKLNLDLYDFNKRSSNVKLGSASFDVSLLESDSVHEDVVSPINSTAGKPLGELVYDVTFFPVLTEADAVEEGADLEGAADSAVGIVRLVVHQAKELDTSNSMSAELNPFAKVYINNSTKAVFSTPKYKHTNNPVWEAPYEFLCSNKESQIVTVKIIDDRDFLKDPSVGHMSIKLVDLLQAQREGKQWFPLSNCKSGKLRVSAIWKPVSMAGNLHGPGHYTPPIGVVRLAIEKAVAIKNVDSLGGKSDPYVLVQVRNETKGRTEVIDNTLNPVWNQIFYVPVHSLKESIMLECMDYEKIGKHRSLGSVEVQISNLAKVSTDPRFQYEATGPKSAADPLTLNNGETKGELHYQATFIPSLNLKNAQFEKKEDDDILSAARKAEELDDDEGGYASSSSSEGDEHADPVEITIQSSKKGEKDDRGVTPKPSVDVIKDAAKRISALTEAETPGIELSPEELVAHESGIVVFNVVSGKLSKKGRVEITVDEAPWPSFVTTKARSTNAQWDQVGEGFVKELDFSQVAIRLDEAIKDEHDHIVCEWKGDTKQFLRKCLGKSQEIVLEDPDGRHTSTLRVEALYIPTPMTLDPSESANNQGTVTIDVIGAYDLRAADRGGKSDPYATFTLNGSKVYKTETIKKTLTPEWNENFEAPIPSRADADFQVEVFDWNQIEQPKSLGVGKIDVASLPSFQATEVTIPLSTVKHGPQGFVRLMILFRPMIIAKARKPTSTFSSTFNRAATNITGLPSQGKGFISNVFRRE